MVGMEHAQLKLYPEIAAGGFTRSDGSVAFYSRVRALLGADDVVLDFGAGRGRFLDSASPYSRRLQDLRGDVARVIGVDPDPAVLDNPTLDEALVMTDDSIPVAPASVDLVLANWVFEHVGEPAAMAAELDRVLKPGGWICARTPNKWGYWAVGARLFGNRTHTSVLRRLGTVREDRDVFPTRYRMNTPAALRALFPGYELIVFGHTPPPMVGSHVGLNRVARGLLKLAPERTATILFVFARKGDGRIGDG